MLFMWNCFNGKRNTVYVSEKCWANTIDSIQTHAEYLNIQVVVGPASVEAILEHKESLFGIIVQAPDNDGLMLDFTDTISALKKETDAMFAIGVDIMSLMSFKSPKSMGADLAYGLSQRFGIPMGYGGPHAAFLACEHKHIRKLPGRVIGVTQDADGKKVYRMCLQTREQHIKREKATSNICTAQALLAIIAQFYGIFHGASGLNRISKRINGLAVFLAMGLESLDYSLSCGSADVKFFDTVNILAVSDRDALVKVFESRGINIRNNHVSNSISISVDECTKFEGILELLNIFAHHKNASSFNAGKVLEQFNEKFAVSGNFVSESMRRDATKIFEETDIFADNIKGEHEFMRYIKYLENKDINLTKSMIPLGSCTMKLNAAVEMTPLTWPTVGGLHPFVPANQALGYKEMYDDLTKLLCITTHMDAISFQPNSGATGEYAGLLAIRHYQKHNGQGHRDICLTPSSAHGTNPASAKKCGLKVVVVKSDALGNVDFEDLKLNCEKYKESLSCLMITYPSTHGVFEDRVKEINGMIHEYGGQVYMDGANMNAQCGITSPGFIDADVCHLNLHKTFCIPHGGGGPGLGPICVKKHLEPYLPGHTKDPLAPRDSFKVGGITAAHLSSASIATISYIYLRAVGRQGIREATEIAILNSNYMKSRLEKHYPILYQNENSRVAHEFIIDIRPFKKSCGITESDVCKRLLDYGFHGPTVSWPVAGTIMVEPTESESKEELDRYCDAFIQIRKEIKLIEDGIWDKTNNVIKNSPHTSEFLLSDRVPEGYPVNYAAFPLPFVAERGKYWPPVRRVNDLYGDKNPNVCEWTTQEFFLAKEGKTEAAGDKIIAEFVKKNGQG